MSSTERPPAAARGRPRAPEIDSAILDATVRHLAAKGYLRMSIDGIAADAGVTKPTIYRRFKGKVDLTTAAIRRLHDSASPPAATELRAALEAQLHDLADTVGRLGGMSLVGTVLAEEHHHPELLETFRERLVAPRRRAIRAQLERFRAAGAVRDNTDLDQAVRLLVGGFYALYIGGEGFTPDWAEGIVDAVIEGIAPP